MPYPFWWAKPRATEYVGPPGPRGPDGPQGPPGPQGPVGPAGAVPVGVICMWAGLLVNIPSGWHLCDGTAGTPDLRDKFILGAPAGLDPGDTGGSASHTHTAHSAQAHGGGAVANNTTGLSINNHSYTPAGTVSEIAATTTMTFNFLYVGSHEVSQQIHTHPAPTFSGTPATLTHSGSDPGHNHSFTQPNDHPSSGLTHSVESNVPVYYTLAFIMKV